MRTFWLILWFVSGEELCFSHLSEETVQTILGGIRSQKRGLVQKEPIEIKVPDYSEGRHPRFSLSKISYFVDADLITHWKTYIQDQS